MFSSKMQRSLLVLLLCLWAAEPGKARQIRISRYEVSDQPDEIVPEVKQTGYAPAGYRPEGRSFWLPGEVATDETTEGSGWDLLTSTTELPADATMSTTTAAEEELTATTAVPLAPFTTQVPVADSRAGRAFVRGAAAAPYPPAGYRPSRAFKLPTEQAEPLEQPNNGTAIVASNANNPVCGVSTNPLKPTPQPGSKDEPEAETVLVTANLGPTVLVARAPIAATRIPIAIPLRSQRLLQASPPRGFSYSTHVLQRW